MYGKNHTDETKTIMSEAKKGKPRAEGVGKASQQIEVTAQPAYSVPASVISYKSIRLYSSIEAQQGEKQNFKKKKNKLFNASI